MEIINHYTIIEYNQETYAWYYFGVDFDDWYIDSFHLWDDNHFHLLLDESTPPYVEHILESRKESSMHTLIYFYYFPILVDDVLSSSTYLDPYN